MNGRVQFILLRPKMTVEILRILLAPSLNKGSPGSDQVNR